MKSADVLDLFGVHSDADGMLWTGNTVAVLDEYTGYGTTASDETAAYRSAATVPVDKAVRTGFLSDDDVIGVGDNDAVGLNMVDREQEMVEEYPVNV